jgi:hypothetical protein
MFFRREMMTHPHTALNVSNISGSRYLDSFCQALRGYGTSDIFIMNLFKTFGIKFKKSVNPSNVNLNLSIYSRKIMQKENFLK